MRGVAITITSSNPNLGLARGVAYSFLSLLLVALFALYSTSRDLFGDIIVYYDFYDSLASLRGTSLAATCASFEPIYCGVSYVLRTTSGTAEATHLAWVCIYYVVTWLALRRFWLYFFDTDIPDAMFMVTYVFICLNFVDPQQISYLVRQYVSSSILVYAFGGVLLRKSPLIPSVFAFGVHFGSLPVIAILVLAHRGLATKWVFAALLFILAAYAASPAFFHAYVSSVQYKLLAYQGKNDGDVTPIQEFRLLVYVAACLYIFNRDRKIFYTILTIYVMYIATIISPLFHLRYYKYLEVLTWPSVFVVLVTPFFRRFDRGCLLVAISSIRFYKYVALAGDDYGATALLRTTALTLLSKANDVRSGLF